MIDTTPLFVGLVFSSVGLGYVIYGRRQQRKPYFYSGLALMLYPYLVTGTWPMVGVGVLLLALPRFAP
ncbi:hypothetical protein [Marinobacter bohaiensis]|uniref:hypothetical protein n=1 Tax=Marinobacter bohaiensis TaxID=2201898 RepID=UPI001D1707DD|nr:hypothetical protein [Marinobacter bohaiensis]